jgi:prepilin-type N-terminal cleavage/methylation domain-containing protein
MKKHRSQEGFTLIEVLVAILLLTVGILAAASMQVSALTGNSLASRLTQASTLAGATVEELMALGFEDDLLADTVPAGTINSADSSVLAAALNNLDTAVSQAQQPEGFEIFWNVADNYPFVDCKTIRVMVRFGGRGVVRTVALDMVRMRPI